MANKVDKKAQSAHAAKPFKTKASGKLKPVAVAAARATKPSQPAKGVSKGLKSSKPSKPAKPSGAAQAKRPGKDGELDPRITNREFKLLLNPEGLDRRSQVNQLIGLVSAFCEVAKVDFFHLDNAATSLRNIYFFDTPDQVLRQNRLILRVRESRRTVWVDDWCEVTLKCRTDTLAEAVRVNPTPNTHHAYRLRLKEEILRGAGVATTRTIYANNAILDSVPVDAVFERNFGSVAEKFPGLSLLRVDPATPVQLVGGRSNKILEAVLPMGNLTFGDRVHAHLDIGIWMRNVGEPIIGELAFAYRVNDDNRGDLKAHKRADRFFVALQNAIPRWLAGGTTKTALVYGKPE